MEEDVRRSNDVQHVGEVPRSDWWYGIAIPAVLTLTGYIMLRVTGLLHFGTETNLGFFVAIFTAGLPIIAGWVLTPVFIVSLYMDAKRHRDGAFEWNPNPIIWASLGLFVPILGFFLSAISPLMVMVAGVYLYRRWRYGTPIATVADDVIADDATARSGSHETDEQGTAVPEGRITRWWYGIAIPLGAYGATVLAVIVLFVLENTVQNLPQHRILAYIAFFCMLAIVLGVIFSLLSIPVYSYSLYKDLSAVREANTGWEPNRRLWIAIAVFHLLSIFVIPSFVTVPAGIVYLYNRHEKLGTP